MREIVLLILLALGRNCFSQTSKISYAQNTKLTLKLLDTLKNQIDTTYKLLIIDGDIYDDKSFHTFAKTNHFTCAFIRGNLDSNCMNTLLKSISLKITSNPYLATIVFNELSYDYTGNIFGYFSVNMPSNQKWEFDKFNKPIMLKN